MREISLGLSSPSSVALSGRTSPLVFVETVLASPRFQPPLDDQLGLQERTEVDATDPVAFRTDASDRQRFGCTGAHNSDRLLFGSLSDSLCSSLSAILTLG